MSKTTDEVTNQFMTKEFSQEITDEEAMLFIACCPDKQWTSKILIDYLIARNLVDTPYRALKTVIMAYLDTMEEENGK